MSLKNYIRTQLLKKRERLFSTRIINLKNVDVTILCNCCIGGCFYHDAKVRFQSPTINLYFEHHGFIDYIKNLKEYTSKGTLIYTGEMEECNKGPVGILRCDGFPDIRIHFLHYDSFENAKKKWIERSSRINFDKIFLVIEAKETHEHQLINEYLELPYPSIIFTDLNSDGNKLLHMKFYDKNISKPITSFVGISGRKGFDEYDFIENIFNYDFKE